MLLKRTPKQNPKVLAL